MRLVFIALRVLGALAVAAAVVGQLQTSLAYWRASGLDDVSTQLVNFFSFFTIESNLLGLVLCVVGGVVLLRGGMGTEPVWFTVFRVCVTAYMATTGVVYNTLLRGIELPQGSTLGWSNEILHVWMPLLVVVDWLFAPGRNRLEWRRIGAIVVFPIVWAVYTLVRGPLVTDALLGTAFWYPYPFLNPNLAPTGYASVAFYVMLIAVLIGLVGAAAIWVSRRGAGSRALDAAV